MTYTKSNKCTRTFTDEVECPHGCGHFEKDLWDYNWNGNNEEIITECENCNKPITLRRIISISYVAIADELEE